jgi:hypothetical protein
VTDPVRINGTGTLLEAILAVQAEAPTLPKDKTNPHYQSRYTPLDTIVEKIGPILSKHGLVWMTFPAGTHDEPTLKYQLSHAASSDSIEGEMPLLLDRSSAQAMGSAITYMRRYSLCAVLNLVADDDDDGHAAGTRVSVPARPGRPSDKQKELIEKLARKKGATIPQLQVILDTLGVNVTIEKDDPSWMDALSPGRDGTASDLITFLNENPLPSIEHRTDVPAADDGFEHEPQKPLGVLG